MTAVQRYQVDAVVTTKRVILRPEEVHPWLGEEPIAITHALFGEAPYRLASPDGIPLEKGSGICVRWDPEAKKPDIVCFCFSMSNYCAQRCGRVSEGCPYTPLDTSE